MDKDPDSLKFTGPCGCVRLLVVNEPDIVKESKRDINWALSIGCRVDTKPASEIRAEAHAYSWSCNVCLPPKASRRKSAPVEQMALF